MKNMIASVTLEKMQLKRKLDEHQAVMMSDMFGTLSPQQRDLMSEQAVHMQRYGFTLKVRLNLMEQGE